MFKTVYKIAAVSLCITVASCSEVVEPIQLTGLSPDATQQEEFDINLQPLTFEAAKALNTTRYDRMVSRPGRAFSADVVKENAVNTTSFPPNSSNQPYKLGIGDEVALIQYADNSTNVGAGTRTIDLGSDNSSTVASSASNIISTTGRIGTDGSLLLIGVGRLDALGRDISELRDEVRSILIRNGKAPNFQMEIKAFNSKKAYITTDTGLGSETDTTSKSAIIPITDQGTTVRELMAASGIAFDERRLTLIRIQRAGRNYSFTLADLFSSRAPDIYLQAEDHVFVQNLEYQSGKVFLLGGVTPTVIPIQPEKRQTLAEALFAENGPLATSTAQRSAVYLLRGRDPVQAYHLDAQNPLSVLVADAVELRPNDIVFVAEQPITTFNRTLASLIPLRMLLSDIRDNNLP